MKPPRLLAISPGVAAGEPSWTDWCAAMAAVGVPALQVREKGRDDAALLALVRAARSAFPAPRLLIVNARADIARAGGADGVQLPATGLPVAAARRLGGGLLVGRSTHDLGEVRQAQLEGVDYVLLGPIWSTPAKRDPVAPLGVSSLADAARLGVPVLAVGGIDTPERAAAAVAAGAHGVAGIRAFAAAESAAALVAALGNPT